MTERGIDCVVIDAGARYGLHPSWSELHHLARLHLFELDPNEAERLRQKYADASNIVVHPVALDREAGHLTIKLRRHEGLHSAFPPNVRAVASHRYMLEEQAVVGEREVPAVTIDGALKGSPVHFLKLDTEGSELRILEGAQATLAEHVLGIRCEVSFVQMLADAPLFGDIDRFLTTRGFELLNLDYSGRGHASSHFTMPGRYGKLVATDAVWVVSSDRVLNGAPDNVARDAVRLALFLLLNHASDVAIDLLQRAAAAGVDFKQFDRDPLFRVLQRKVLLLFKELSYLPYADPEETRAVYRAIFRTEFPQMNDFYQSKLLD